VATSFGDRTFDFNAAQKDEADARDPQGIRAGDPWILHHTDRAKFLSHAVGDCLGTSWEIVSRSHRAGAHIVQICSGFGLKSRVFFPAGETQNHLLLGIQNSARRQHEALAAALGAVACAIEVRFHRSLSLAAAVSADYLDTDGQPLGARLAQSLLLASREFKQTARHG